MSSRSASQIPSELEQIASSTLTDTCNSSYTRDKSTNILRRVVELLTPSQYYYPMKVRIRLECTYISDLSRVNVSRYPPAPQILGLLASHSQYGRPNFFGGSETLKNEIAHISGIA